MNFSLSDALHQAPPSCSSTVPQPPPPWSASTAVLLPLVVCVICLLCTVIYLLWSRPRSPPTPAMPFQLMLSAPPSPIRRTPSEALLSPRAVIWHHDDEEEEYERLKASLQPPTNGHHRRVPSPLHTSFQPSTYAPFFPPLLPDEGTTLAAPPARLAIHIASHLPLSTLLCEMSALNSSWRYSLYRHPYSCLAFANLLPVVVDRSDRHITIDGHDIDISNTPSYFSSSSISLSSTAATLLSSTLRFLPHVHYRSTLSLSSALTTIIPAVCSLSQLRWLRLDDERPEVLLHIVMKVRKELRGLEVVADVSRNDARMIRRALQSVIDRPLIHLALTHTLADAFLYRMATLKPPPVMTSTLESVHMTLKRSSLYPVNPDPQLQQLAALPRLRLLHLSFTSPAQYQPTLTGWCALANLGSLTHLVCPLFSSQQLTLLSTLPVLTSLHFTAYPWCAVPSLAPLLSLSSLQSLTLDASLPSLDSVLLFPASLSFLSVSLSAETKANNTAWLKRLLSWEGLIGLRCLELVGTAYACEEHAIEELLLNPPEASDDASPTPAPVDPVPDTPQVCDRLEHLCLRGGLSALWSARVRSGLTSRFGVWDERNREGVRWWTEEATWRRENGLPPSRVEG